jgi:uncharacterized protein (TIGR03437 family)
LIVTTSGGTTAAYDITVNPLQPGLLAPYNFNVNGVPYVVALFQDGTYALPTGAIAGISSRPANPGDVITLYGVGFGPVAPASPAGEPVQQFNSLSSTFQISTGGVPITPSYDGLAPGYTGRYQLDIAVPSVAAGNQPLTFNLGGTAGTQTLYLPIGR